MTVAQLVDICLVWTWIRICYFYETIKISVFYINQKLLVIIWLGEFYSSSCRNKHLRWHWVKGAANGEDREDLSRRSSLYQWCSEGNWSSSYRHSCSSPDQLIWVRDKKRVESDLRPRPEEGQVHISKSFTRPWLWNWSWTQEHMDCVLIRTRPSSCHWSWLGLEWEGIVYNMDA